MSNQEEEINEIRFKPKNNFLGIPGEGYEIFSNGKKLRGLIPKFKADTFFEVASYFSAFFHQDKDVEIVIERVNQRPEKFRMRLSLEYYFSEIFPGASEREDKERRTAEESK